MKSMKKNSILVIISFCTALFLLQSCGKEDNKDTTGTDKLEFVSLVLEKDTITVQDVTKVTATAKGTGLTYSWSCDNELGIIEGSGSEILFTICHTGKFKISCKVTDAGSNEVTKDVYVTTIE